MNGKLLVYHRSISSAFTLSPTLIAGVVAVVTLCTCGSVQCVRVTIAAGGALMTAIDGRMPAVVSGGPVVRGMTSSAIEAE